ncbi:hypothetical protein [Cerasicoccus frondis]|uniref:hypothetical protein n=1 Tax=Cerasicoccus frondis TaxID=490090 RepID=UPI00285292BA|nr:hypothetical protein [Cerasicoccus frondis]
MKFSFTNISLVLLLVSMPVIMRANLEEARESMLTNSPFQKWEPPAPKVTPPPAPVAPSGALSREVVFKGTMRIGENRFFNLFDKVENRSVLMEMDDNSKGARFTVVSFNDSGDRSVTLRSTSGMQETIYLAKTDGVSIPTATAAPVNSQVPAQLRPENNRVINRSASTPNTERRRRVIPRRINTQNGE